MTKLLSKSYNSFPLKLLSGVLLFTLILIASCKKDPFENDTPDFVCAGIVNEASNGDNSWIFMPNAFSPNNDNLNDTLLPACLNISTIKFTVYNKDGAVLFTTSQTGAGWSPGPLSGAEKLYYRIEAVSTGGRKLGSCGYVYRLSCIPANMSNTYLTFGDMLTLNGFTGVTKETLATCP